MPEKDISGRKPTPEEIRYEFEPFFEKGMTDPGVEQIPFYVNLLRDYCERLLAELPPEGSSVQLQESRWLLAVYRDVLPKFRSRVNGSMRSVLTLLQKSPKKTRREIIQEKIISRIYSVLHIAQAPSESARLHTQLAQTAGIRQETKKIRWQIEYVLEKLGVMMITSQDTRRKPSKPSPKDDDTV